MGASATQPFFAKMKTGTYIGDGIDNRDIDIGIDLFHERYKFVMVWQNGAVRPVFHCTPASGDMGFFFDETAGAPDTIQTWTTTGFQVGTRAEVNTLGVSYKYIALWQSILL